MAGPPSTEYLLGMGAMGALALFLIGASLLCAWRGTDRAFRGPLALFFLLVGLGFLADALSWLTRPRPGPFLQGIQLTLVLLDPPVLLLFIRRLTGTRVRALLLPVLALAAGATIAVWAAGPVRLGALHPAFRLAFTLEMLLAYGGAFALLARHLLRKRTEPTRATFLLALVGMITLPRLALLPVDYIGSLGGRLLGPIAAGTLLVTLVAFLAPLAHRLRHTHDATAWGVRRGIRLLVLLALPLGALWSALAMPAWQSVLRPLVFPARWFLILGLLEHGLARDHLAVLPLRWRPLLRTAVSVLFTGLAVLVTTGALLRGTTLDPKQALSMSIGALALVVGLQQVNRFTTRGGGAPGASARYLSHLEAGTDAQDLAVLRARLQITEGEARDLAGRKATPRPWPAVGSLFAGRYLVDRLLDHGSRGPVLSATDEEQGARVVLKVLRHNGDPRAAHRELRALLSVRHPALVRLLSVEPVPDGVVLVLEDVPGPTLREARDMAAPDATRIAVRLLDGLACLHDAGIVHGDLKPDNIVLRGGRDPILIDLGSAWAFQGPRTLPVERTPGYAAPETVEGTFLPASDVFSAGKVLAELGENIDPRLREAIVKALEPAVERRWKDARTMAAAIARPSGGPAGR